MDSPVVLVPWSIGVGDDENGTQRGLTKGGPKERRGDSGLSVAASEEGAFVHERVLLSHTTDGPHVAETPQADDAGIVVLLHLWEHPGNPTLEERLDTRHDPLPL